MGTIYYLIPDLHKRDFSFRGLFRAIRDQNLTHFIRYKCFPKHKAVGGIKVMYQHCIMLQELGYKVYPLLMGDYVGNFYGYDIDFRHINDIGYDLDETDVVVATELFPYEGLQFPKARKILFMQNWINIDRQFKESDMGKSYIKLGYDYVITCGQFCSDMVKKKMNVKATTIINGIDQEKFFEKSDMRIPRRVLAMSRKNIHDLEKIIEIVRGRGFDVDLHVVDGLTQDELIKEYQQADIFLVTGYPEGLPLPPLEAMNCGCAIVGFTGGGASEYMIDNITALVAEDGDCSKAADNLIKLFQDEELKETIRVGGMEKASQYTLENTKKMLGDFYSKIVLGR